MLVGNGAMRITFAHKVIEVEAVDKIAESAPLILSRLLRPDNIETVATLSNVDIERCRHCPCLWPWPLARQQANTVDAVARERCLFLYCEFERVI